MAQKVASLFAEVMLEGAAAVKQKLMDIKGEMGATHKASGDLGAAFQQLTGVSLTGAGAIAAVGMGLKVAISEAIDAERAMSATNAVIKSTGGAAGMTADEIAKLANREKDLTGVDDAVVQGGENMLLTFTKIGGETFPRASRAMMDMAAAMAGGNMDAIDLKSTAIQLGKALNEPLTGMSALQRVGVTFSASQKATVKAMMDMNDVAGAQGVILAELEREFGGMAEAMGSTNEGKIRKAKQSLSDLAEAIGARLIPWLGNAADAAMLLATASGKMDAAYNENAKTVLTTARSYEDYIAEMQRELQLAGILTDATGRVTSSTGIHGIAIAKNILLTREQYEINRHVAESMKGMSDAYSDAGIKVAMMGKATAAAAEDVDKLDKATQAYNADIIGQMDKMPKLAESQATYKTQMAETRDEIAKLEAENAKLAKSQGTVIPLSMKQLEDAYINLGKAMDAEKAHQAGASAEVQKWDRIIKGTGTKQYIDNSKAIADNTAKIIDLKIAEAERAIAHEKMTKQVLLDTMKERFAIKGWAEDEVAAYTQIAVGMGLMTQEQATQATTQAALNAMYDEGKLSAEQYASAMLKSYQQSTKMADGSQEVDVKTEGATGSMNVLSRRTMPESWSKFEITTEKAWALAGALAAVQAGSDINITVGGNLPTTPPGGGGGGPTTPPPTTPVPNCFIGETPVDIPGGQARIDSIRIGDAVMVYDTELGEFMESSVVNTHTGRRSDLVKVVTTTATAVCSPNHLWLTKWRGFVRADSLLIGEKVKTRNGYITVLEVSQFWGERDVFNLTVAHMAHTYCVNGHVVHNAKPPEIQSFSSGAGSGSVVIGPINVYASPNQDAKQVADAVMVELAARTRAYRQSGVGALKL